MPTPNVKRTTENAKSLDRFGQRSNILTFIFLVGLALEFVFILLVEINTSYRHGIVYRPVVGILTSDRYTAKWWLFALIHTFFISTIMNMLYMIWWRSSQSSGWLYTLLNALILLTLLAGIIFMIIEFIGCNDQNQADNLCNDVKYCCLYYNDTQSGCPDVGPCPYLVTESDLKTNPIFMARFIFGLVFFLLVTINFIFLTMFYSPVIIEVLNLEANDDLIDVETTVNRAVTDTDTDTAYSRDTRRRYVN